MTPEEYLRAFTKHAEAKGKIAELLATVAPIADFLKASPETTRLAFFNNPTAFGSQVAWSVDHGIAGDTWPKADKINKAVKELFETAEAVSKAWDLLSHQLRQGLTPPDFSM